MKTERAKSAPAIDKKTAHILSTIDWERNLGFLIHEVSRLVVQAVNEGIQGFDLTSAQLRVFLQLTQKDGVSQVSVAEFVGIKKASTGVLLERLEEKGLIERSPDEIDRRANLIFLSSKALGLLGPVLSSGNNILNDLMRGIGKQEQELLVDLVLRMKSNAQLMIRQGQEQ